MERLELDPEGVAYGMLNACVVPRPIAWVSTVSAAGVPNLAPHSYFTVASVAPPVVQFTSVGTKDSLRNIRETGEFVVCMATRPLAELVNLTATDYPPEVPEAETVGLAMEPSQLVAPARVADSPVALECRSVGERDFGGSVVIFGEVLRFAVGAAYADDKGRPDLRACQPVSRLGANDWGDVGEVFALRRIPYAELASPSGGESAATSR